MASLPGFDGPGPSVAHPQQGGLAKGKVILLGEHSAVYGYTALAGSLDLRVEVWVLPQGPAPTLILDIPRPDQGSATAEDIDLLHRAFSCCFEQMSITSGRFEIIIKSELPLARGMGSSAALAVATLRALALLLAQSPPPARLHQQALEVERLFHGNPSGVDVAVAVYGGLLQFRRGPPMEILPLSCPFPLPVVVVDSGQAGSTSVQVAYVAHRYHTEAHIGDVLSRLGALAAEGVGVLQAGDLPRLGGLMDAAHILLSELGVSTDTLNEIVTLCRAEGALGAKLTGAGGGGVVLALGHDHHHVQHLAKIATRRGYRAWATQLGGTFGVSP